MASKTVNVEGVTIRYTKRHCGFGLEFCDCHVFNNEGEAFCFKYTDILRIGKNGDELRHKACREENPE